jgi:hypothetical protein
MDLAQQPPARGLTGRVLFAVPVLGCGLIALATLSDPLYRAFVQEDALLEWAQVLAYLCAVSIGVLTIRRLWRLGDPGPALVLACLSIFALLALGEELSWGQRLLDFETPELARRNRQGELNLHNDARFEVWTRLGLLVAGLYGSLAPLVVRRSTPLVPPRALVPFFGVVAGYFAFRLLFLEHPTYTQAKFSEWPEFCFALALLLWCADLTRRRERPLAPSSR